MCVLKQAYIIYYHCSMSFGYSVIDPYQHILRYNDEIERLMFPIIKTDDVSNNIIVI